MAGISVGGHGKRDPNSEIPLVPFIDLLLCCVMFLLVTAVWNQLARIDANQRQPGAASVDEVREEMVKLVVQLQADKFVVASTAGDRLEIPKRGDAYDMQALRDTLQLRRQHDPNKKDLVVAPDDGVRYEDVVESMDVVVGSGFSEMTLSDGSTL